MALGHRVHVMAVRAPRKNIDIMIPCLCLGALAMLTGSLAALGKPDITFILGARQLCQRSPDTFPLHFSRATRARLTDD